MFHEGKCLPGVSARGVKFSMVAVWMAAVLAFAPSAFAQRRGGGGTNASRPTICIYDCSIHGTGISTQDDLKNFDHLLAVQATPEQSAAFNGLVQDTEAVSIQVKAVRDSGMAQRVTDVDQAIGKVRSGAESFLASLSVAQKSGLKDEIRKWMDADSALERESKALETVQSEKADRERVANLAANVDKALAAFRNEQGAMGSEMSILLPSPGQELAFHLPQVTNSIDIAGQPVSMEAAGVATRMSAEGGRDFFNLKLIADLSDLQQSVTDILRRALDRAPSCGERMEIQQAQLRPAAPAGVLTVQLHYERWTCPAGVASTELVDSEGDLEVKITPSIDHGGELHLAAVMGRVNADGLLRERLVSGAVGAHLGEQIAALLAAAMQKGVDAKATLPPIAQEAVSFQKARFEEVNTGQLRLIVEGEMQFSDSQVKEFASQLKERLSAEQSSVP